MNPLRRAFDAGVRTSNAMKSAGGLRSCALMERRAERIVAGQIGHGIAQIAPE